MFKISSIKQTDADRIKAIIDQKIKPLGALGQLESLAQQMALILSQQDYTKIKIKKPTMLVFAADHGIAEEGISIAPSEVTQQMVLNFLNGGAAINCFCSINHMQLKIIDAGILLKIDDNRLIPQSLGHGTHNFTQQSAMSVEQVDKGLRLGANVCYQQIESGSNVIGFGEMGIANTSSAAAIMASILNIDAKICVGRGTGIDDTTFQKKISLIEQSLKFHQGNLKTPIKILANIGGFEIVQMVGAMLAAAEKNCLLLIDGFIATAAALVASQINTNSVDYMVFCHQSNEQGHKLMLKYLKAKPLLSLDLRLGEGTGAALALPLLHAAASFYNNMASFKSAGIEI